MGGVSAFGAPVAGLEPTFFQGSDASRAVDTPPSICTSWGGRVKWAQKGVPATSVYVCACDLGHHQQGGWAVRCCEVKPPTPPAAHTAPTHAASARKWVRGGGARLRLIDAAARTQHHLSANPHLPWPTKKGAREGNLNAGEGWWDSTHRVVLIIFGRLMGSVGFWAYGYDRTTNILVCLTLAQENANT